MTEALKIPNKVIDSDWRDDIDYEPYGTKKQEMEYVSPQDVSQESIEKIKSIKIKFGERGHKISKVLQLERA